MAKDYGRRPSRQRSSAPKQVFWVLASFLGGYLAATVFDFTSLTTWINTQVLGQQNEQKNTAQVVAKPNEMPKPKFEFYTLLAKDRSAPAQVTHQVNPATMAAQTKVVVSPSSPAASVSNTPTPAAANQQTQIPVAVTESKPITVANTSSKESYLLQLASFKNKQEAERLKAALTLKGFDVHVAMSSQQQGNWFRVVLGPFHSRGDAEKARMAVARRERITGMIRKMDA